MITKSSLRRLIRVARGNWDAQLEDMMNGTPDWCLFRWNSQRLISVSVMVLSHFVLFGGPGCKEDSYGD